ncbi:MAG: autotransporter domain-containing protein [Pseudomonadota bacterium]
MARAGFTQAIVVSAALLAAASDASAQDVTMSGTIDGSSFFPSGPFQFNFTEVVITVTDVTSFVAQVTSSMVGPVSTSTQLVLFDVGTVDPTSAATFFSNILGLVAPDTPITAADVPTLSEDTFTLVVLAAAAGDTGDFVLGLTGAVFGVVVGPGADLLFEDLQSVAGSLTRIVTRISGDNIFEQVRDGFEARKRQQSLQFSARASGEEPETVFSTRGGQLVHGVYTWGEIVGVLARQDNLRRFDSTGIQFGADFAVSPNVVVGLALGYNTVNGSTPLSAIDGDFYYAQPYVGLQFDKWTSELSFTYGETDYDQSSIVGPGTADGDVWSTHLSVARDFNITERMRLSPQATFHYGEESLSAESGVIAGATSQTVDFGEFTLGARATQQHKSGFTYFGLHADYVFSDAPQVIGSSGFDTEGLSGRVEVGGGFAIGRRGQITLGTEFGGIGASLNEYSAELSASFAF